jgi:FkbM family methyltransferase
MQQAESTAESSSGAAAVRQRGAFLRPLANQLGKGLSRVQFPGKYRLVSWLGGTLGRACPEADCYIDPRSRLTVNLAGRIERFMWAGCYEPELVALLKAALEPGMVFVDVGAHIGYFTILGASRVGPGGAVHSFEADPVCFARLAGNAQIYPQIFVHHAIVGDQAGEASFFRTYRHDETGWGTVFPTAEARPELRLPVTTLDESFAEGRLPRLDFIKLDVEGAECRVLRGAERTIAAYRPLVFFEVNEVCLGWDSKTPADLIAFFQERRYSVERPRESAGLSLPSLLAIPEEKSHWRESLGRWG